MSGGTGAGDIRIVSGNPDDAELAALTVALAALLQARPAPAPARVPAAWLRGPVHVAPAAWTAAPPLI